MLTSVIKNCLKRIMSAIASQNARSEMQDTKAKDTIENFKSLMYFRYVIGYGQPWKSAKGTSSHQKFTTETCHL